VAPEIVQDLLVYRQIKCRLSPKLLQMLKEEKEKTREVEEDRQLFVMTRKGVEQSALLENLDTLIQRTQFWTAFSNKLTNFNFEEEEKAQPIYEVLKKLDEAMIQFCDSANEEVPEVVQNVMAMNNVGMETNDIDIQDIEFWSTLSTKLTNFKLEEEEMYKHMDQVDKLNDITIGYLESIV